MKIVLCNAYFYRLDSKQWKTKQPYPPLGTLYAAAILEKEGHDLVFVDNCLERDLKKTYQAIESHQPDYFVIYEDGFNYLTKMCLTSMRDAAMEMIKYASSLGAKVLCCGSDSTDHFDKYLKAGADYVILGEGEVSLKEIIKCESLDTDPHQILGIAFKDGDGTLHKTGKRPVIRDLDTLPDPSWHLVDFKPYRDIWIEGNGYFSLNIATTRGCPFKCNWCAKPIYGNRYNSRSPDRVVQEMAMLNEKTGVNHFWICDDIFGLKPGWVQKFSALIQKKSLDVQFKIQSRVDLLLESDTIESLVKAGVKTVWVGAESGSQKILDAMDKGTKVDQIEQATRLLQRHNVDVGFFLQFGYLGESKQDIDLTIKMLLTLMPDDIGISVSYPLPDTGFYEKVVSQMREKQNWVDSDDLAMMYKGTFSQAYYRRLHRYVHKLFRHKQIVEKMYSFKSWFSRPQIYLLGYYWFGSLIDRARLKRLEN